MDAGAAGGQIEAAVPDRQTIDEASIHNGFVSSAQKKLPPGR